MTAVNDPERTADLLRRRFEQDGRYDFETFVSASSQSNVCRLRRTGSEEDDRCMVVKIPERGSQWPYLDERALLTVLLPTFLDDGVCQDSAHADEQSKGPQRRSSYHSDIGLGGRGPDRENQS